MTRPILVLLALIPLLTPVPSAADTYSDAFTDRTLRIDVHHLGTAGEEHLAVRRLTVEGPWPGRRRVLQDETNFGKYLLEVADLETHRVLYSQGFASLYGEWETTSEARDGGWQSIEETWRIPEPRKPVQLRLRKRQKDQGFAEIWTHAIDPASRFVERPQLSTLPVRIIEENGPIDRSVDLLVIGDGYTSDQRKKFDRDTDRAIDALFSDPAFGAHRGSFNLRSLMVPNATGGVPRPRAGEFHATDLGFRYNTFDSERYVTSLDEFAWRDAAASAPYDFVLVLVNERQYGGGGIYQLYSTAASDSGFFRYLVIHEFAHHFAGLADEYYTSSSAYEDFAGDVLEPWEPNVTALNDPDNLKWGDLVVDGTPLPTPWDKPGFEEFSYQVQKTRQELRSRRAPEEELEALFTREREHLTTFLAEQEYSGRVGAFEGAMYSPRGYYRPTTDCIMFSRDEVGFCPVCRRAIEKVIELYTR